MKHSRNKKGSLSLSINAIVILILAITMLALGIGFIKNLFPDISAKVQEKVTDENEPPIPSRDNPITFSRDNVIGVKGDSEFIKVSVYCNNDPGPCTPILGVNCPAGTTADDVTFGTVAYRKIGTGIARLELDSSPGNDICTFDATTTISADNKQAQIALTIS